MNSSSQSDTSNPQQLTPNTVILSPTLSVLFPDLEYSVHVPSKLLKRDVATVFPDAAITLATPLIIIPTFQKSTVSLLEYGDEQAKEKDRLLLRFFEWCERVCHQVSVLYPSAWIDATDPASGMAWRGASSSCYSDVDGVIGLLHYDTIESGGCRILSHPRWNYAVYPTTLFTTAPPSVILQALTAVNEASVGSSVPT